MDDYMNFEKHILQDKTGHFVERFYKWENTNFMLRQPNYNGLKTGITDVAGPCLSASFKNKKRRPVVVYNNTPELQINDCQVGRGAPIS